MADVTNGCSNPRCPTPRCPRCHRREDWPPAIIAVLWVAFTWGLGFWPAVGALVLVTLAYAVAIGCWAVYWAVRCEAAFRKKEP